MPKPKLIPDDRREAILERAGRGETPTAIAAWLTTELGKTVSDRRVREFLEGVREEREPAAKAVIAEKTTKTVGADLDAVEKLLSEERGLQEDVGKLDDVIDQLDEIAQGDVGDLYDEKNRLLDIKAMPKNVRMTVASIESDELFGRDGEENKIVIGITRKVKVWDKTRAIEIIARIRDRAVAQQKTLLELRLKLAGANGGNGTTLGQLVPKRKKPNPEGGGGSSCPPG